MSFSELCKSSKILKQYAACVVVIVNLHAFQVEINTG